MSFNLLSSSNFPPKINRFVNARMDRKSIRRKELLRLSSRRESRQKKVKSNQKKHSVTKHKIKRISDEDDDENNFLISLPSMDTKAVIIDVNKICYAKDQEFVIFLPRKSFQ